MLCFIGDGSDDCTNISISCAQAVVKEFFAAGRGQRLKLNTESHFPTGNLGHALGLLGHEDMTTVREYVKIAAQDAKEMYRSPLDALG